MSNSEENYWIADNLYDKIKEDFYDIENGNDQDKSDLIDKTIENAEEALEIIEKIDLKVLKKHYGDNIYNITKNVETFKEQADYVLISLKKMRHNQQRNPLPPKMWDEEDHKNWKDQEKERRESGIEDKTTEFDIMGESFISFDEYKKILNNDIQD